MAGDDAATLHQAMAATLDTVIAEIKTAQDEARTQAKATRPRWPMIVLRTPKGWTGPKEVDGLKTEDFWRSHQIPVSGLSEKPEHISLLETWMRSYKPDELFDATGKLRADLAALAPEGTRRMGANPHANGGLLLKDLKIPDFRTYAVDVPSPGTAVAEATPFDMVVRNDLDRFHLVSDVIDRVPQLGYLAAYMKQKVRDQLMAHREYITTHRQDMPEISDWKWSETQGQPNGMGEQET